MKFSPIPKKIIEFSKPFASNGFQLYVVGGAVRDFCLGNRISDYDFTTDATPEQVRSIFRRVIPTGIKHGTVTVLFSGEQYEVTTFRSEADYQDKRHPDHVAFVKDLSEDLKRRDFTINALAVRIPDPEIIDLHHGIEDMEGKVIRCIGDPVERFEEDALRMMRACRFSAKLGFRIEEQTFAAICRLRENIRYVSSERIQEELSKILMSDYPGKGLRALEDSGLLAMILPELAACDGVEQLGFHHEDVFGHSLSTLEAAVLLDCDLETRLAALFHDIGKPKCRTLTPEGLYTFYNHDIEGSRMAETLLRRLKYSNNTVDKVCCLIRNHMFNYSPAWTDGAVRRLIQRVSGENLGNLVQLRLCDQKAMCNSFANPDMEDLLKRVSLLENPSLTVNDLAFTGDDLKAMGFKPGPLFSRVKLFLLEQVLDCPELNTKEKLSEIAEKYLSQNR